MQILSESENKTWNQKEAFQRYFDNFFPNNFFFNNFYYDNFFFINDNVFFFFSFLFLLKKFQLCRHMISDCERGKGGYPTNIWVDLERKKGKNTSSVL